MEPDKIIEIIKTASNKALSLASELEFASEALNAGGERLGPNLSLSGCIGLSTILHRVSESIIVLYEDMELKLKQEILG